MYIDTSLTINYNYVNCMNAFFDEYKDVKKYFLKIENFEKSKNFSAIMLRALKMLKACDILCLYMIFDKRVRCVWRLTEKRLRSEI